MRIPLASLPRNARVTVLLLPLWAVPGTITMYYAALYMRGRGMSNVEIGTIMSASMYLAFVCQLFAGMVIDRFGRKLTTVVFYFVSWVIPMLLWAVAHNFWVFLAAYVLNATSEVEDLGVALLASEEASERQRPQVFAGFRLAIAAAGLLTPVAGVFMARFGTMPTLRFVYVAGAVSMFIHMCCYGMLVEETRAGRDAMASSRAAGVVGSTLRSFRLFAVLCRSRELLPVVTVYVLTNLAVQFNVFQVVYLSSVLGFGSGEISALPALGAVAALAGYLLLMPRVAHRVAEHNMRSALVVCCVGWLAFLFTSRHDHALLLAAGTLTVVGPFLLESYRDAVLVNRLAADDRALLFSATKSVTAAAAIPAGYVSAVIYDREPRALFAVVLGCYAVCLVIAMSLRGRGGRQREGQTLTEAAVS